MTFESLELGDDFTYGTTGTVCTKTGNESEYTGCGLFRPKSELAKPGFQLALPNDTKVTKVQSS